jgi:hypothetical protein
VNPEERAEARLTAEMLGAAGRTDLVSAGLTLLVAAALTFSLGWQPASIAALALGLAGRYFGFRVGLDRRLFGEIAEGRLELADLDAALRSMSGGAKGNAPRSIADRCRGARRLLAMQACVVVAQLAATTVAALAG